MISIIVSSINPSQKKQFEINVRNTIGVPYELLIHDNRSTNWGLCQLYNYYASRSKYEILAFCHEDISFHTQGWGRILVDFYSRTPNAGVLGFAGSTLKTKTISGWESYKETTRLNIIQRQNPHKVRRKFVNPLGEDYSETLTIDGLAMFVPRAVWNKYQYDQNTFRGFHFYDLDYSMQVAESYKNYICFLIDVEHYSKGSYPKSWYNEAILFQQKWGNRLPYSIHSYQPAIIDKAEANVKYKLIRGELTYSWGELDIFSNYMRMLLFSLTKPYYFKYVLKLIKHILIRK